MKNHTYACGLQTPYKIWENKSNFSIGKFANDRNINDQSLYEIIDLKPSLPTPNLQCKLE